MANKNVLVKDSGDIVKEAQLVELISEMTYFLNVLNEKMPRTDNLKRSAVSVEAGSLTAVTTVTTVTTVTGLTNIGGYSAATAVLPALATGGMLHLYNQLVFS